jgi:hypothetical protein
MFGQLILAVMSTIAWTALHLEHSDMTAPWYLKYWRDMGFVTVVGTIIGCLAYPAVISLYNKGHLNRFWESMLLQIRDLKMGIQGVLWSSRKMKGVIGYWTVFAIAQVVDAIYICLAAKMKERWVGYVVDKRMSQTAEFNAIYPVKLVPVDETPLRKKIFVLFTGIFFVRPFVAIDTYLGFAAKRFLASHGEELKAIPGVLNVGVRKLVLLDEPGEFRIADPFQIHVRKAWGVVLETASSADMASIEFALKGLKTKGVIPEDLPTGLHTHDSELIMLDLK